MNLRIGLGIDVHRLEPDRRCVLGGVDLESPVGPVGHSDGDALLHAACDAVLGAAGLDDLGTLFPDDDPAHHARDSADFCAAALTAVRAAGFRITSLDAVVETNRPILKPARPTIRHRLATLFDLDPTAVNVKGKSGEKVGPIGRGEALRATVVALLTPT